MLIRYGYDMSFIFPQATPVVILLDIHNERRGDIQSEGSFLTFPLTPDTTSLDFFGNRCRKLLAPQGNFRISTEGVIKDSGLLDAMDQEAREVPVADLPPEALFYLAGSRYCETDKLCQMAWDLFGSVHPGWARVQAICDFVHDRLTFGYQHARCTRTAAEANFERKGVCRDFAHLSIALCRAMNIPARYVNGYLGDIGIPRDPAPMDFSAWFEVYLGGSWHTFDARHNQRRIGRIVVARGRDAADVPLINSFGQHHMTSFNVTAEEIETPVLQAPMRQPIAARALSQSLPAQLPHSAELPMGEAASF